MMLTPTGVSMGGSKEVLRFEFKVLSLLQGEFVILFEVNSI